MNSLRWIEQLSQAYQRQDLTLTSHKTKILTQKYFHSDKSKHEEGQITAKEATKVVMKFFLSLILHAACKISV